MRTRGWIVRAAALVGGLGAMALLPTTSAAFTSTTGSAGSAFAAAALAAPTGLDVVQTCAGGVPSASLSWTPSTSTFGSGYHVTRASGPTVEVTPIGASSATEGPLADGTTYSYEVTAFRGAWASAAVTGTLSTDCSSPGTYGAYLLAGTGGASGSTLLTRVDTADPSATTNESNVGTGTGAGGKVLEGIDIEPGTGRIVAVGERSLGTLNPTTGLFTSRGTPASARGAAGSKRIDRIKGASFDPANGRLWVVHDGGSDGAFLLRLDPGTGAVVPDTFGSGVDYVVIGAAGSASRPTSLAIDPITGRFLAVLSTDAAGTASVLVSVNPATGATTTVASLAPYEVTGLDVEGSGQLRATGHSSANRTAELLLRLNSTTGAVLDSAPIDNGGAYRSVTVQATPAWVGAGAVDGPTGSTLTLGAPLSVRAGDLLLAVAGSDTTPINPPAGWTRVRDLTSGSRASGDIATNASVFWKVATAADAGASFAFAVPGASDGVGVILAYRGARVASPVAAENGVAYPFTTAPTAPSVAPAMPGARLVTIFEHEQPGSLTPPAGMTERLDQASGTYTLEVSDQVLTAAGATGTRTAGAGSNDDGTAFMVALAPG